MKQPRELPRHWLSVDPGERHTAICSWRGRECVKAVEVLPNDGMDMIDAEIALGRCDLITYEKWILDARHMGKFAGKELLTSQVIGGIERTAYRARIPFIGYANHQHKRVQKMGWFLDLSLSTRRALPWWVKNPTSRGHCMDAWTVGLWHQQELGWEIGP